MDTSSGAGSTYINGALNSTGTLEKLTNTTRSVNWVGTYSGSDFLNGQIAEIIVYSQALTTTQIAQVQSYLMNRYLPTIPAPIISVPTGTLAAPQYVAIAVPAGQQTTIYYTTNGTTPSTSSPVYSGPINISYSQTLQAIAVGANGVTSSVASATYSLNSTQWPAPSPTDTRPLQMNLQLPTTAIPQ